MQDNKESTQKAREQRNRFVDAARAAGANDDETAFKAKLAEIARQKPAAQSRPASPERKKPPKK